VHEDDAKLPKLQCLLKHGDAADLAPGKVHQLVEGEAHHRRLVAAAHPEFCIPPQRVVNDHSQRCRVPARSTSSNVLTGGSKSRFGIGPLEFVGSKQWRNQQRVNTMRSTRHNHHRLAIGREHQTVGDCTYFTTDGFSRSNCRRNVSRKHPVLRIEPSIVERVSNGLSGNFDAAGVLAQNVVSAVAASHKPKITESGLGTNLEESGLGTNLEESADPFRSV
jgi:hypothetical protein